MDKIERRIQLPYSFASLKGEALEEFTDLVNQLGEKLPLAERQAIVQQRLLIRELVEREKLSLSLNLNLQLAHRPAHRTAVQLASLVQAPISGSAIVVSPRLLMTAYNTLPRAYWAENAVARIRFEYASNLASVKKPPEFDYLLEPADLFLPCEELDFTLVALLPAKSSPQISEQDVDQLAESEEILAGTIRGALPSDKDLAKELTNSIPILSSSRITRFNQLPSTDQFRIDEPSRLSLLLSEAARNRMIIDWIRNRYQGLDAPQQDLIREFFKVQSITPLQVRTTRKFRYPPISLAAIAEIRDNMRHFPPSLLVAIKLDIFSGRKNPECCIDFTTITSLVDDLDLLLQNTPLEPKEFAYLGYRGFWIKFPGDQTYYVPARLQRSSIPADRESQELLIRIHRLALEHVINETHVLPNAAVDKTLLSIKEELSDEQGQKKNRNCPDCMAQDAPVFDLETAAENCYAYALDVAGFRELNVNTNNGMLTIDCTNATQAAIHDGLQACADFSGTLGPGAGWYAALCIHYDGYDYHWFRQDKHGCWSHLPPGNYASAQDTDYSGSKISDPQTCDRNEYTDFCTFMITR